MTVVFILLILKAIRLYHDYVDWYERLNRKKVVRQQPHPLPEYLILIKVAGRIKSKRFDLK